MAARPLDGLLPIRQILVDGEATPFLRDLDFQSTGFSVTVDEANGRLVVDGTSTFGDGFVVNDENSNVALRVLNGITEVQGDVINIATELNTTVNVGNGADTLNVAANDINLGADNILSLAAPTVRLGGAAASDRLTVSGAFSIITADVPDGTIFNVRSDVFGIYEAAQPSPSFVFSSDADAASSLTFGSGTTVTIGQTQSLSGAGRTLTIRGQQGQAGQVGADLILAGGRGGTPGTNNAGAVRIKCGDPVSFATRPLYLEREDGTKFLTVYEQSTATVGLYAGNPPGDMTLVVRGSATNIESNSLHVALIPNTDLYMGHGSNRFVYHRESGNVVLTEKNRFLGATEWTFADGPTSIAINHTDRATSGVGASFTIQAQRGNGNKGGNLVLAGGAPGTASTHEGGDIILQCWDPIASSSGRVSIMGNATEWLGIERNPAGGNVAIQCLSYGLAIYGGGSLGMSTSGVMILASTQSVVTQSSLGGASTNGLFLQDSSVGSTYRHTKINTATYGAAGTNTVLAFATTSNRVYRVEAVFIASNDTDNQGATFHWVACFKNVGGTVTQIGTSGKIGDDYKDAGQAGLGATIDFSGTDIRARFTTDSADTVNVNCVMTIYERVLA